MWLVLPVEALVITLHQSNLLAPYSADLKEAISKGQKESICGSRVVRTFRMGLEASPLDHKG